MATLVCFHAHPDDETTATGGTIARAAAEGHRVVLVLATDGRCGEVPDDLAPDETLVERRRAEAERSAEILGISRIVWLGYEDSGMTGWEQNDNPACFWKADIGEAAARLADVLVEEQAGALTIYDWHGNYGHPDHVQVHRVGVRAAEMARIDQVFEATMNRDRMRAMYESAKAARLQGATQIDLDLPDGTGWDPDGPADDGNPFGTPEAEITHALDITPWLSTKRRAMAAHASQVSDSSFFMAMPADQFAFVFGTEWYTLRGSSGPPFADRILDPA
jgi:LmbE family N-acetylglucosaminyl deacetylase